MSDPWAASRQTLVLASRRAAGAELVAKVYRSFPGALYAAYQLAAALQRRAEFAVDAGEAPGERRAAVWQLANFSSFVAAELDYRPPAEWWCCALIERPRAPDDYWTAMREAGLLMPLPPSVADARRLVEANSPDVQLARVVGAL